MTATQLSQRLCKLIGRGCILLTVGVHVLLMLNQKEGLHRAHTRGLSPLCIRMCLPRHRAV